MSTGVEPDDAVVAEFADAAATAVDGQIYGQVDGQVDIDTLRTMAPQQWSALHWLSRALHIRNADVESVLQAVLEQATVIIPGASAAGINLLVSGRFEPQAVHGAAPPVLDALQQRTGEGPCIDASREQRTISVVDLGADDRWPDYRDIAVRLGVRSMLCLPLYFDSERLGSLSLYAADPDAFGGHAVVLAELFAAHAALALSDAQRAANLQRALHSRDVIGQAKGILMERHRITDTKAFELLARVSQQQNRKLADIAFVVAGTGELPSRG